MKDLSPLTIISIIVLFLIFLFCVKQLWKEWKEGRKPNADDLLHDLNFKIECFMVDNYSERHLIKLIKELRQRSDIDKEKLDVLDTKFRRRFQILHQ